MTKDEWRQLLDDIYRSELAPLLQRYLTGREKHHPVNHEKMEQAGRKLVRALHAARFLESYFDDEQGLEHFLRKEFLQHFLEDMEFGLRINYEAVGRSGLADVIQRHIEEIASMLEIGDLPQEDLQMLRDSGSPSPESELRVSIQRLRHNSTTVTSIGSDSNVSLKSTIHLSEEIISTRRRHIADMPDNAHLWKRDFTKGLVDTCRGAAVCLSNTALLILAWPASPAVAAAGALGSVAVGVSDLVMGVRELNRK